MIVPEPLDGLPKAELALVAMRSVPSATIAANHASPCRQQTCLPSLDYQWLWATGVDQRTVRWNIASALLERLIVRRKSWHVVRSMHNCLQRAVLTKWLRVVSSWLGVYEG